MDKQPSCNREKYDEILQKGFRRFPRRKENYEKYISNITGRNTEICLDYMPVKMDYEVSSICNFRCTSCLMSELADKRPPNMSFEMFTASIDQQYGLVEVKLQGLGEPLLNKDFFRMAEYVVDRDIWGRTTTNASILHLNDNYKKLIDSGLGEIQVSIDGATPKTFESIRRGADFAQILKNCELLNNYASIKGEQWKTSCWMLVQKENVSEMEKVLELAGKIGFTRMCYQMSLNDFGSEKWQSNREKTVNYMVDDVFREQLMKKGQDLCVDVGFWDNEGHYKAGDVCPWPFGRAYITAEMELTPCCLYWDKNSAYMGSARDFVKSWNSEKYINLRKGIISGNISEICKRCYGLG